MATFTAEGFKITYDDTGEGDPILLLHGFAADRRTNWSLTGWYKLLQDAGYRVIAADARGHGRSDKPSDPEAYAPEGIAGDAIRLMDHLEIERADFLGYSMGGRNVAWLLLAHPQRMRSAVIAGAGLNLLPKEDAQEWEALDRACRISITRFYRDRAVWQTLGDEILPRLAVGGRSGFRL